MGWKGMGWGGRESNANNPCRRRRWVRHVVRHITNLVDWIGLVDLCGLLENGLRCKHSSQLQGCRNHTTFTLPPLFTRQTFAFVHVANVCERDLQTPEIEHAIPIRNHV
jgi:hypothetical protein